MCTRNDAILALNPGLAEKSQSLDSNEWNEKYSHLSVVPDSSLECLQPGYNPKHIQKVVNEAALLATGGVAILLQIANPVVGEGVDRNSNFAYRPIDRLRTTMTYIYCMAFGTPHERKTIIEMVHRAHIPVRGPGYSADDPAAQLWVAATLYACGLDIYEKIMGKLDQATADKVYQEYAVMALSLRVPAEMWPKDRKAFWAYWDENIATLQVSQHAKNVANDLLYNKHGPIWLRANLPFVRILTAEWLPPRMREIYGLKSNKPRRAIYRVSMGLGRTFYPMMPRIIREYPLHYYLKDMRKRMAKAADV